MGSRTACIALVILLAAVPQCVESDEVETAEEWWVEAHFDATEEGIGPITASQLGEGWRRVSILTESSIERFKGTGEDDVYAEYGFRFELGSDLNGDGREERVLVGVYETDRGESGRFIIVLTPNAMREWDVAFVSSLPTHNNFSALLSVDGEVRWYFCMLCGNFVTLRWVGDSYYLR